MPIKMTMIRKTQTLIPDWKSLKSQRYGPPSWFEETTIELCQQYQVSSWWFYCVVEGSGKRESFRVLLDLIGNSSPGKWRQSIRSHAILNKAKTPIGFGPKSCSIPPNCTDVELWFLAKLSFRYFRNSIADAVAAHWSKTCNERIGPMRLAAPSLQIVSMPLAVIAFNWYIGLVLSNVVFTIVREFIGWKNQLSK